MGQIYDIVITNTNDNIGIGESNYNESAFPININIIITPGDQGCFQMPPDSPISIGGKFLSDLIMEHIIITTPGTGRMGAPYRAPLAGYRKSLICGRIDDGMKYTRCRNDASGNIYKDSPACDNPSACYDKRIRSGMQPKQQFCIKNTTGELKKQKKLMCPLNLGWQKSYSFSYSQYNKDIAMNTYKRGLEKNIPEYNNPSSACPSTDTCKNVLYPNTECCQKSLYRKSGGDNCVSCISANKTRLSKNAITVWKPNNNKFKVQGAVTSGSRLERLKLDTVKAANSKCKKGERCDTNGIGKGYYLAGQPRFDGWMFNARHHEVVCENKYRQQPFGIPQLTNRQRSTRSNLGHSSWKDSSQRTSGLRQRGIITSRAPACGCPDKLCPFTFVFGSDSADASN